VGRPSDPANEPGPLSGRGAAAARLSYRLIGVKAVYHWGDVRPRPLTPVNQIQVFFARVFPAVFLTLLLVGLTLLLEG